MPDQRMLLDRIERAIFDFVCDNGGFPPTHLIIDHVTAAELSRDRNWYVAFVDGTMQPKCFNLVILSIPRAARFVAVARLMQLEGGS